MKKFLLGSVALAALSAPAIAADMRVPVRRAPPPAPVFNWTGCYIGFNAGTTWGRAEAHSTAASVVPLPSPTLPGTTISALSPPTLGGLIAAPPPGTSLAGDDWDLTGFIGGGHLGCQMQFDMWVIGVEGDYSATNKEGQAFTHGLATASGIGTLNSWVINTKERWLATARGRLGIAWDKFHIYVTGGAAWTKVTTELFNINFPTGTGTIEDSVGITGWTIGGGYEYALTHGWSIRSEYLYVDFDSFRTFVAPVPLGLGALTNIDVSLHNHIWRAGLTYKFF